jgi:CBS domain-containing protein
MNTAPVSPPPDRAGDARRVSVAQILGYELRVADAMSKPPITAGPADSLRFIQNLMRERRISGVPITQDGKLLGIVSIEDIINALDKGHINDPADKWMTREVVTLLDYFSLMRAVAEFDRRGFGRFPILDSHNKLVGILSRGDITNCLMHQLEKRAEEAVANEAKLVAATAPDDKTGRPVVLCTAVRSGDFDQAGRVAQQIRQVLRTRGIEPDVRRRAAIVAYEAETNIIIHSIGGEISTTIFPERVVIEAVDKGPGIEDLDLAMREGWSTAGPLARRLGFGAGMGLPNMKRCSDQFDVVSNLGTGTRVHAEIVLKRAGTKS